MIKSAFLAPLVLCCGAFSPAWSQPAWSQPAWSQNAASNAGQNVSPKSSARMVAPTVSLGNLLQLQSDQSARLGRLSDELGACCAAQESKISQWQGQIAAASLSNSRRASRGRDVARQRDIEKASQKIVADWKATRLKARQVLSPVQRLQLDSLASDSRFRLRPDALFGLLLAPIEISIAPLDSSGAAMTTGALGAGNSSAGNVSTDEAARRNWLEARRLDGQSALNHARGTGSYGVYGGYGYGGPQVGVYGGYQQGAIGVHGGIGRGGPSIGVSIGRVFGIGRR